MRQQPLQHWQGEEEKGHGQQAIQHLGCEDRLVHRPIVVVVIRPRGHRKDDDAAADEERHEVIPQEVNDEAAFYIHVPFRRFILVELQLPAQLTSAFFLGALQEQEGDPHEDHLHEEAREGRPDVARGARPRRLTIVIAPGAGGDAADEHAETHDDAEEALGDEGCALKTQDELDELEFVRLVDDEKHKREPSGVHSEDGDARNDHKQNVKRVAHLSPETLVVRKHVVPKKGPEAIATLLRWFVLVRVPVQQHRHLPQDLRARIRPRGVDGPVLPPGHPPRHVRILHGMLCDARDLVDDPLRGSHHLMPQPSFDELPQVLCQVCSLLRLL
mmetsp:Transcript_17786/g.48753  ORF Transcript_17786/g.48753 Transcript_17786/m.48753 type:complete len:330 (+) Transcript_17786:203-1192(+)